MQTQLIDQLIPPREQQTADDILRSCVHCGFCTATCPTYQVTGNELDGPRGRIYQIKSLLEGEHPSESLQLHLDRCLLCRACESTCPSGVKYSRLYDIAQQHLHHHNQRSLLARIKRLLLGKLIPSKWFVRLYVAILVPIRRVLPHEVNALLPKQSTGNKPTTSSNHARTMLVLDGCVQPNLAPEIDTAMSHVLDRLGIRLITAPNSGCCGAVDHHLGDVEKAKTRARDNIDAWWPALQDGCECIIATASGCGQYLKEYGTLLEADPNYAEKAALIARSVRDPVEVIESEDVSSLKPCTTKPIAFHPPCTLQHGQRLPGRAEDLLTKIGFNLTEFEDKHLCCGSAGTYSILQPKIANELRTRKLEQLTQNQPELIATANIGCITHLRAKSPVKVVHWIELVD